MSITGATRDTPNIVQGASGAGDQTNSGSRICQADAFPGNELSSPAYPLPFYSSPVISMLSSLYMTLFRIISEN